MKKQRTAEEMQQVLLDFDVSGQSVREYCAKAGIAEHLLRYWLKRRAKRSDVLEALPAQGFSELKISATSSGFSLVLPRGLRLGIASMPSKELASLLLELDRQSHA
jgi:hypothetical protein